MQSPLEVDVRAVTPRWGEGGNYQHRSGPLLWSLWSFPPSVKVSRKKAVLCPLGIPFHVPVLFWLHKFSKTDWLLTCWAIESSWVRSDIIVFFYTSVDKSVGVGGSMWVGYSVILSSFGNQVEFHFPFLVRNNIRLQFGVTVLLRPISNNGIPL